MVDGLDALPNPFQLTKTGRRSFRALRRTVFHPKGCHGWSTPRWMIRNGLGLHPIRRRPPPVRRRDAGIPKSDPYRSH